MFHNKAKILFLFIFVIFSQAGIAAAADADDFNMPAGFNKAEEEIQRATGAAAGRKQQELLSAQVAKTFYGIGYELYTARDANFLSAKQALVFFNAAISLDGRAGYVLPDIINIAWQYPQEDFSDVVRLALKQYIDNRSDLEVASKAVGYLLERLDSREQRQKLLESLLMQFQQKNIMFASDLQMQLGLLTAETGDAVEAQTYLVRAFSENRYNRLAFAKLAELAASGGQPLPDISYLQNLRFAVRANPLDFDSAFRFAHYCRMLGLYEPAAVSYKYCADLLKYLSGRQTVGPDIYRPWILSSYNAQKYDQCRQILQELRSKGIFDIQVEAFAAKAVLRGGDENGYKEIINGINTYGDKILTGRAKASTTELEDLTWFYSFVADVNADQILTWATKAYDADPNSRNAASLFAYALVLNNQSEFAEPVLEKIDTVSPVAAIAKATILLRKEDVNSATDLFKKAVYTAPGSFESLKAAAKFKQLDPNYTTGAESAALLTALQNDFGKEVLGQFVEPEKMVSIDFKTKGEAFSYGSEIEGSLALTNESSQPIVISPDAMLKGNLRVDVKIAGDLTEQIEAFIVKTVRPSYEIRPGSALFIPMRLDSGKVKQILDRHPQAELNIEYTAYIDPITDANGQVRNSLAIKPAKAILTRRKLDLSSRYLQQRFDAIRSGHPGQKAKSVELFAGLLAEQQEFRKTSPAYKFIYAEPELLSSAIARCLIEDDWILKVQTIAAISNVELDYRLIETVSDQLNSSYWPVRLLALFVLDKSQGSQFAPVLDWTAKNDVHPLVKELAAILSGNVEPVKPTIVAVEPNLSAEPNVPDTNLP